MANLDVALPHPDERLHRPVAQAAPSRRRHGTDRRARAAGFRLGADRRRPRLEQASSGGAGDPDPLLRGRALLRRDRQGSRHHHQHGQDPASSRQAIHAQTSERGRRMRHSNSDRTMHDIFSPVVAPGGLPERILRGLQESRTTISKPIAFDVAASSSGISRVVPGTGAIEAPSARARTLAERAREELAEYLGGARSYFTVPVDIGRAAPFPRDVLAAARTIPFGEVRSYRWIAARVGSPKAVRAVGTALGRNPVPILVPCHRVL